MFPTKIGENGPDILNCCFSRQIYTVISNKTSTYTENIFVSHKQYLFSLLTSRNVFFDFAWKETTHKTLIVAAEKTSVYVIGETCFDECFLFFVSLEGIIFLKRLSLLCRAVGSFFIVGVVVEGGWVKMLTTMVGQRQKMKKKKLTKAR